MTAPKWWDGYPDAGADGVINFPIVQAINGLLWSEDMDLGPKRKVTVTLGKKEVAGWRVDGLSGGLLHCRMRWVSNGAASPWSKGYPGPGWRSHIQALVRGDTGAVACCSAYGLSAKSLAAGVLGGLHHRAADAAKAANMSIHPGCFNVRLSSLPEEDAGEDGKYTPWNLDIAATADVETYKARLERARSLQWWADAWL